MSSRRILSLTIGLIALPAVAIAAPERSEAHRPDGSTIHWNLDRPAGVEKAGIIVLAQGSGCLSVDRNDNLALMRSIFQDFAALTVEKYGVSPDDKLENDHDGCSAAFYEHHTISQRVKDYSAVIDDLRKEEWWNGKLVLIGGSEGGDVVARLAAPTKADAAIMISTGGGKTFGEMVQQSILDEMKRHSVPKEHWPPVEAVFEKARKNPESSEVWAGSSYRFWADAIDHRSVDSMLRSNASLLLIQGGKDTSTPVELARIVADTFAEAGRCNLTYWEFPGYNHGMADADGTSRMRDVLMQSATWLQEQLSLAEQPACMN
ncbi:alpha/beta hydrolase family protein [Rhizobium sullae]|uniref:Alpha/beta hydrolase n=1 Tax=Rhizobium sullae TaxID=50338 RepID=A0A4R3Q9S7_RHISU|nr:hypothetical protein [Rhizobium sullae]TCU18193.1 hypothetical protein EV132_103313 [Rhizobium sullae]